MKSQDVIRKLEKDINLSKLSIESFNKKIIKYNMNIDKLNKIEEVIGEFEIDGIDKKIYICKNIKADKTCVNHKVTRTYNYSYNQLIFSHYKNILLNNENVRIYSDKFNTLCNLDLCHHRYTNVRNPHRLLKSTITIEKSPAWEDPVCKSKIKSAFKKIFKMIDKDYVTLMAWNLPQVILK